MSFFPPTPQPGTSPPFVLWLKQEDLTPDGHFRPAAAVEIAPVLRTSGLLRELPGEELKTLLLVLTFVTLNGHCLPTLPQLADGLHMPSGKMQVRLKRLQAFSWQGEPLLHPVRQESGLYAYAPSSRLIETRQASPSAEENQAPVYSAAGREAIIAHSRATYARPRAEVEREIALLNGWPLPEARENTAPSEADRSPEEREQYHLKQRLLRLGVSNEQADFLLSEHTMEEVALQIEWLPYRNAKNPAGFLVAAIEGGYEEPLVLRRRKIPEDALEAPSEAVAMAAQVTAETKEVQNPSEMHTLPAFDLSRAENIALPPLPSQAPEGAGITDNGLDLTLPS